MEDLGIDRKLLVPRGTRALADVAGSYTYFADGDVLLAKITPCFENGKLGIAANLTNGVGFGSSEYMVFRPSPALDKVWLYYYLSRETFRTEGAARMSGAVGHKRVAKEFIDAYPIPVPPLPEQQRIVGILDEAFDGIATAKANAEKKPPKRPRPIRKPPAICFHAAGRGMEVGKNQRDSRTLARDDAR